MKIIKNLSMMQSSYVPSKEENGFCIIDANYDNESTVLNLNIQKNKIVFTSSFDAASNTSITTNTTVMLSNVSSSITVSNLYSSFTDHGAFVLLGDTTKLDNNHGQTQTIFTDLFKLTLPTKSGFSDLKKINGKEPYAVLIVPYANSSDDDLILMIRSPQSMNVSNSFSGFSEVLPDLLYKDWKTTLYPTLVANTVNTGVSSTVSLDIQLADQDGTPIKREGVTIYLENLGGVLDLNRIVTDSDGIATANLTVGSVPTNFKIKAGFKYYSGVINIPVNVT